MAKGNRPAGCKAFGAAAALALAAALGPAFTDSAGAVDLPPAPTLPDADASAEPFAGWYLRGDLGAGFETAPKLRPSGGWVATDASGWLASPYAASFRDTTLTPSASVGAGVGYVFSPWFRADATLEYRFGGRLRSSLTAAGPAGLASDTFSAGVSSLVALATGYVDLGEWWGVTPFIGAGVGVADTALSGVSEAGFAVSGAGAVVPVGGLFSNASRTNFAWALTAGLAYAIAPNLRLELSYRYLNLGPVALGGRHCVAGVAACAGAAVAASSRAALASNDVRIGLVWLVGEPPPAAPIAAR